jgi:hypothetical protein
MPGIANATEKQGYFIPSILEKRSVEERSRLVVAKDVVLRNAVDVLLSASVDGYRIDCSHHGFVSRLVQQQLRQGRLGIWVKLEALFVQLSTLLKFSLCRIIRNILRGSSDPVHVECVQSCLCLSQKQLLSQCIIWPIHLAHHSQGILADLDALLVVPKFEQGSRQISHRCSVRGCQCRRFFVLLNCICEPFLSVQVVTSLSCILSRRLIVRLQDPVKNQYSGYPRGGGGPV